MPEATRDEAATERRLRATEALISNTLRLGVTISFAIIMAGLALTFVHHPEYIARREALPALLHPARAEINRVGDVLRGAGRFEGRSLVLLGLFLLIATPVVRVAISVLIFLHLKDRPFVAITLLVLTFLMISFFLGRVGGG